MPRKNDLITYDLIVVGGGAAGFFGAIQAAELHPGISILILEKTSKLLTKVRISGGGRCNVTHHCLDPVTLSSHYPRGRKVLRKVFKEYDAASTIQWFDSQGVKLKIEEDGRMFPTSDNSATIIESFLNGADTHRIEVLRGHEVTAISSIRERLVVSCGTGSQYAGRCILVATGGSSKPDAYNFLTNLGHTLKTPIPSLFTFNNPEKSFSNLMGVSVSNAEVMIAGSKFRQRGPVLITHWGLSGPAVIRLSAWAAEYLFDKQYSFTALVNWTEVEGENALRNKLATEKVQRARQFVLKHPLFRIPDRLWGALCLRSDIDEARLWSEMSNRQMNKLLENLLRCPIEIRGKTTFKEEFVTCGGIDLSEVNPETMESRKVPNLYFAGEVLDIDGETGGFNFQSAWSTAHLAARSMEFPKLESPKMGYPISGK